MAGYPMPTVNISNSTALVLWRDPLAAHRQAAEAAVRERESGRLSSGQSGSVGVGITSDQTRYTLWNSLRSLFARHDRDLAQVATSPLTEASPSAYIPRRAPVIPPDVLRGLSCPSTPTGTLPAPTSRQTSAVLPTQCAAGAGSDTLPSFTRQGDGDSEVEMDVDSNVVDGAAIVVSIPTADGAPEPPQVEITDLHPHPPREGTVECEARSGEDGEEEALMELEKPEREGVMIGAEEEAATDDEHVQIKVADEVGSHHADVPREGTDESAEQEEKEDEKETGITREEDVRVASGPLTVVEEVMGEEEERVGPAPVDTDLPARCRFGNAVSAKDDAALLLIAEVNGRTADNAPTDTPVADASAEKPAVSAASPNVQIVDVEAAASRSIAISDGPNTSEEVRSAQQTLDGEKLPEDSSVSTDTASEPIISPSNLSRAAAPNTTTASDPQTHPAFDSVNVTPSQETSHALVETPTPRATLAPPAASQVGLAISVRSGGSKDESFNEDKVRIGDTPADPRQCHANATSLADGDTRIAEDQVTTPHQPSKLLDAPFLTQADNDDVEGGGSRASVIKLPVETVSSAQSTSLTILPMTRHAPDAPATVPACSHAHPSPASQAEGLEHEHRSSRTTVPEPLPGATTDSTGETTAASSSAGSPPPSTPVEERRIGGKRKRFEPLRFAGPARKRGRTPDMPCSPLEDEADSVRRQVDEPEGMQQDLGGDAADARGIASFGDTGETREGVQCSDDAVDRPQGDPEKEQWRVGRLPGHQGSHVIRSEVGAEGIVKAGEKRGLPLSVLETERVLKKPFRLPAKVVLPVKQPLGSESSPIRPSGSVEPHTPQQSRSGMPTAPPRPVKPASKPFVVPRKMSPTAITPPTFSKIQLGTLRPRSSVRFGGSSPISLAAGASSSRSSVASSPTPLHATSPSSAVSTRAKKPFKSPFPRSSAPSPSDGPLPRAMRAHPLTPASLPSASGGAGAGPVSLARSSVPRALSRREYIHELEKEERTLKQALRFLTAPEEDQRLADLIPMWRAAGREVAEMLFGVFPRPEPGSEGDMSGLGSGMGGMGKGMWDSGPYDDGLSVEEKEYVDGAEVNEKGELVGPDGEVIWGQREKEEGEAGLMEMMSKVRPMGGDKLYRESRAGLYASGAVPKCPAAPPSWSIGTMLLRMGVDVGLFGWNDEEEDWDEIEEAESGH